MPTIKEKLDYEQHNERTIKLWSEGGFFKGYERSAYLFVSLVKPYKARRLFVKTVDQDVIEIGFPKSVLPQLPYTATDCGDGSMMIILDTLIDEQTFQLWRQRIVLAATTEQAPAHEPPPLVVPQADATEHEVAERIRQLNMASMTPMQCMVLLAELQCKLLSL
jgi:hypothetical protein